MNESTKHMALALDLAYQRITYAADLAAKNGLSDAVTIEFSITELQALAIIARAGQLINTPDPVI